MKKKKVVNIQRWQKELFKPYRYKIIYGGRGSGKSYAVADSLIGISLYHKHLILCGREFQNSIKESVHSLLKQRIEAMELSEYFEITKDEITSSYSGSRFIFKGLRHNIDSVKSMAGVSILWIEEADTLSFESWQVIVPTIREPNSEIWCTFNPKHESDILYRTFLSDEPPKNSYVVKVNYMDNPYFPDVLKEQMEALKIKDYGMYRHVWEGECLKNSEAQVFKQDVHWIIDKFEEPENTHKYFGLDFGFSQDPTAGIRCYIDNNCLYITHEAYKKHLEIDETGKFLENCLPDLMRYTIYADNSRPETISFIDRQGYSIKPVEKGKGSIEDGIEYLKSFDKIIIHERCINTIREFSNYSYKVDERSGDITNNIVDANNHCLVGDTLVDTDNGQFKIRDLVGTTGMVRSVADDGTVRKNKYFNVRLTRRDAQVFKCILSNGRSITCTKDHMFLTVRKGWQPLFNIEKDDKLIVLSDALRYNIEQKRKLILCLNKYIFKERDLIKILELITINTVPQASFYIDMFISFIKVKYQKITIFITKTIINLIMILQTLFVFHQRSIANIMANTLARPQEKNLKLTLITSDLLQWFGINLKRGVSGIKNIGLNLFCHQLNKKLITNVDIVKKYILCKKEKLIKESFVATLVNQHLEEKAEWITFKKNVLFVEQNLHQINTLRSKHAVLVAELPSLTVIEIKKCGYQDVYNLEVENDHNYTIENGIVTHNCIDATRYACERLMKDKMANYGKWKHNALFY